MLENKSFAFLNGSIEPFTIIKDVLKKIPIICLLAVAISRLVFVAVDVTYVPEYTASGTYVVSRRCRLRRVWVKFWGVLFSRRRYVRIWDLIIFPEEQ